MSQKFPTKQFKHLASGSTVQGEVVVEHGLGWQVAVGGKIQVLDRADWIEVPHSQWSDLANRASDLLQGFGGFGGR